MAEQEVALLHQQLLAARQALTKAQTDNRKLWWQNETQVPRAPEVASLSAVIRRNTVATRNTTDLRETCSYFLEKLRING